MQVGNLQPDAGGAFQAEDAGRIVLVQQHQPGVVLVVAGIEGADHHHLLQARHHPCRRHLPAGGNEGHVVALAHTQVAGQVQAQHHPERTGLQALQHRRHARTGGKNVGHIAFQRRVHAPHQGTFDVLAPG